MAAITLDAEGKQITCSGVWTLSTVTALQRQIKSLSFARAAALVLNAASIRDMDTAGAWLLSVLIRHIEAQRVTISLQGLKSEYQILLSLIQQQQAQKKTAVLPVSSLNIIQRIGLRSLLALQRTKNFLTFLGEVVLTLIAWTRFPRMIQWKSIVGTVADTGYRALPIIALLSFLVGVVLAYQMGLQLRNYGANIYIVDLMGTSVLREFGPLMTAIIVAGRSGSAFTAQIGTMQVNEELDALRTMGISPVERLVLPKLFGLLIALPLLTVWADITGVVGGMIMSNDILGISFYDFLIRFQSEVKLKHYILGLIKTPVFAIIIASIGCYQGLQVKGSADSVGRQTTISVVQSIFLIICADALFSVLYSWYNV